ncbi:MAG: metalloregulator ArsR/SmtB family transcription factor [Acidobacteria bacterium]|nr:metalloregulator ArsR/SmtB family transcription factor [Acidobacteriota bacterium]
MQVKEIQLKETARFFKVLADEARLQMLWLLFNNRELCVCDIMEVLEITQSKASRHLAALRNAGLATDRREGLWSYYSLCPVKDEVAEAFMKLLKASLSKRADSKQLLAKLSSWLKAKQSGDSCQKSDHFARPVKNAKSGFVPTYLPGRSR